MNQSTELKKYLNNLTVDTYINLLDNKHSLGLPLRSLSHLGHLQKSIRGRRSKSIIQPEEIEAKLKLQNQTKKKKQTSIEQQILRINGARNSKDQERSRCKTIQRKISVKLPPQDEISQIGNLSRYSSKNSIESLAEIKLKNERMAEKITQGQQGYKQMEMLFKQRMEQVKSLKSNIEKIRSEANLIKAENDKRSKLQKALEEKAQVLKEQIEVMNLQKDQLLIVFPSLDIMFKVHQKIRDDMSQKQKIQRLMMLQQRLKKRSGESKILRKQLQSCLIYSDIHQLILFLDSLIDQYYVVILLLFKIEKSFAGANKLSYNIQLKLQVILLEQDENKLIIEWKKLSAEYSGLQQRHKKLLKKQSRIKMECKK